jgi:G:T/U-mismatch repair DNA glycosylase
MYPYSFSNAMWHTTNKVVNLLGDLLPQNREQLTQFLCEVLGKCFICRCLYLACLQSPVY